MTPIGKRPLPAQPRGSGPDYCRTEAGRMQSVCLSAQTRLGRATEQSMADGNKPEGEIKGVSGKAVEIWKFSTSMASKMTGGMVGVVTNAMTSNPFLGVAVATALAQTLEKVGTYVIETKLGPRQEIRVGRAIAIAALRMDERIEAGERVRGDAFIQPNGEGRSDADEAAILRCSRP